MNTNPYSFSVSKDVTVQWGSKPHKFGWFFVEVIRHNFSGNWGDTTIVGNKKRQEEILREKGVSVEMQWSAESDYIHE
jgi:hypothetical protein